MRNIIPCLLTVLFLTFFNAGYSANNTEPDFARSIADRFARQWIGNPQEKLYLQTDKPYYSAGEELWFKGYLVNATTLQPNSSSRFIYVELIDKLDSVFYRVKIQKDSLGFAGHMKLKPDVPSGHYTLRAYTYWMQNLPQDFFYYKDILIGNEIDDRLSGKISYGKPENGNVPVVILFTDASHNPVAGKRFEIIQHLKSGTGKKMGMVTGQSGTISWLMPLDLNDHTIKSIEVIQNKDKYQTSFILPEFSNDFDIQFFPESGILLKNNLQSVAFKAIGRDGLSVDVSGKIFTSKNEQVSEFSTMHKGMGKFSIQTIPDESYYALVKSTLGIEKRVELPKAENNAVAIHLVYNRGRILYQVVNQTNLPDNSLYLLIHSRGKVYVIQSLHLLEGQVLESSLPAGVVSFSIIDSLGHTYCERLSFVRNNSIPSITLESDKASYGKREKVNLNLKISSPTALPVTGNFSVSITDSHLVKTDSLADNILSNLLLSSDIKGYIEDPAFYIGDNTISTREKTDVLMMTQGWHRFNTADVVKGVAKQPVYYMEEGQALTGKVLNFFGKPSKKSNVISISPYKNLVNTVMTDSVGRFLIDRIEFPDSTSFVLKARKPKSLTDVEIIPDPDVFPNIGIHLPVPINTNTVSQNDYFNQSKEKYYYEGGMRGINLGEVIVKAEKKTVEQKEYYSGMADNEITSEQLDKYPAMNILNFFYTIPGIQVTGTRISIRGSRNNPMILLDNIEIQDMDEISYLTSNDVQSIQVFKGASASIFGSRGGNGVIAIVLKQGVMIKASTPISLIHIAPLGYQKPAQFYVPKYEVDSVLNREQPDLRTTIYWNPELVADADGTIHIRFYTADHANDYTIVLEGITNEGEICRYTGYLRRNGN